MKKFTFGEYIIGAEPEKTMARYNSMGPYFLKCTCPGCQNFFKSAAACGDELSMYMEFLGADWKKPEEINVLYSGGGRLIYGVTYKIYGKRLRAPKIYSVKKNELGSIRIQNPDALYAINEKMRLMFVKSGKNEVTVQLTAELPWVMETMNCIYDSGGGRIEKPLPRRSARILGAVKSVIREIKR